KVLGLPAHYGALTPPPAPPALAAPADTQTREVQDLRQQVEVLKRQLVQRQAAPPVSETRSSREMQALTQRIEALQKQMATAQAPPVTPSPGASRPDDAATTRHAPLTFTTRHATPTDEGSGAKAARGTTAPPSVTLADRLHDPVSPYEVK